MPQLILAANSGLTVAFFFLFILGLAVLENRIRSRVFGPSYLLVLGMSILMSFGAFKQAWGVVWRKGYMARDGVSWMLNHPVQLITTLGMIVGTIMIIKALTDESPYGRLWKTAAGCVACIMGLSYFQ